MPQHRHRARELWSLSGRHHWSQGRSVEGYEYSDAPKSAGIVLTEAALVAWMADNQGLIPGTKMLHVGITTPIEAEFILTYLRSVQSK